MIYFYKLLAGGYEEHYETIYYSNDKYTQEEFEDIVFQLFEECCQHIIDNDPISVCYPRINFTFDDIFWDYEKVFASKMAEKGFYELNKQLTAYMFFDMTCDNFFEKVYRDIDDSYKKRTEEIINNLPIDESCWDNNCSILDKEYHADSEEELNTEKRYCRENCLIRCRKGKRIQNKSCDNCSHPYMSCDAGKVKVCDAWVWNGKEEN